MTESDIISIRPPEDNGEQEIEVSRLWTRDDHDISTCRKFGYSVGHFYNDLCASMWFTYLMIYLEKVLMFKSSMAGMLMLIGQVTDAVCTPLVGIASDYSFLPSFMEKFGRRMSWHIIGTICVTLSFPFIFNKCFGCSESTSHILMALYFVPFIMIFQFGWASVQISHLALIPELSSIDTSRTMMNSLRYAFTVIANLCVFIALAWMLQSGGTSTIGPEDFTHFRNAGLLVVGGGLLVTLLFYTTTREPKFQRRHSRLNSFSSDTSEFTRMHWTSWFGFLQFYQIALMYMLSRLYVNVSQVYLPFYITMTQNYDKSFVAIIPMVSYMSSFAVSAIIGTPFVNHVINRKGLFLIGLLVGLGNCLWMYFPLPGWKMYTVAVLTGITQSVLLVTSLAITADLINRNTESGAFVYGAMSFVDKLANGVTYQIIELVNPAECDASKPHETCATFYRRIMVFVPGSCLVMCLLILFSLLPQRVGYRRRIPFADDEQHMVYSEDGD